MATYNFTDSWISGTYTLDGDTYSFSEVDYEDAIAAAQTTTGTNNNGLVGTLAPADELIISGLHNSDLQSSFGSGYGDGDLDLLNYVDFDLSNDGVGEWESMINILGENGSDIVGGYATAIDAEGEGFIQVTSNFNGYSSYLTDAGTEDKIFDLWHIDGLSNGDYVTAQIISGTLTDANLHVWGEIDGYQPSASGDQIAWPYLLDDALAIDSTNMDGDHALGDFNYTLNIVTDWTTCEASDYESFDWGYMQYETMEAAEFEDIYWGYIEYDEFTNDSYDDIDWGYAEFDEMGNDIYDDLDWGYVGFDEFDDNWSDVDWGYVEFDEFEDNWTDVDWGEVQYNEFNTSTYKAVDWGEIEFDEFDGKDYKQTDWGKIQYKEIDGSDYADVDWGKVQYDELDSKDYVSAKWNKVEMKEFESDDYKSINWGKVEYNEVLKSSANCNSVNWGKVQTNEWDKGDLNFLTKKSTAKTLDKLKKAELDINVLKKGSSFKGDKDDDIITTSGKLLKKEVKVKGGAGNDTFVLKKGKGSMVIQDFKDKVDEINFAYCGSASKIKLKQKGKDTLIYSGSDLLATVKKTKKKLLKKSAFGLV